MKERRNFLRRVFSGAACLGTATTLVGAVRTDSIERVNADLERLARQLAGVELTHERVGRKLKSGYQRIEKRYHALEGKQKRIVRGVLSVAAVSTGVDVFMIMS